MNVDLRNPLGWGANTLARPIVFPATLPDGTEAHVFVLGFGATGEPHPPCISETFRRAREVLGGTPPPGAHPDDAFGPDPVPDGAPRPILDGRRWGLEAIDKCVKVAVTRDGGDALLKLRSVWSRLGGDQGAPVGALAVLCRVVLEADGVPEASIAAALGDLLEAAALAYLPDRP